MTAKGHQDQFAPLRLSACYWFGELTFIGTSLERETRRFLPFAGSALAVVLPCLICRHRLRPLRLADVADRAEYPAAHITLVSHPDDVECRAGFHSADPDRRRAATECRHGFAAKSRPVPDAPDPRSGPDCGGFHAHDRDPEHRLGNVASAGRRDRGPLRAAHHTGGGTATYIAGLAVMAAAGGETALVVSGVLIGIALSCTASSLALAACARAVPEQSRSKTLGVVAAIGSLGSLIVPLATQGVLAYFPWQIGALFLRHPRRRDAAGGFLGRRLGQAAGDDGGSEDNDARYARAGAAPPRLSGDVGRLFRVRPQPCLSDHAPTGIPRDLRPGPNAERRGAGGHRRCQRRWCLAGGLARRSLSEARLVGPALHPAGDCVRRLLRGVADGDHNADLLRGNGPAVVPWGVAASQRLGCRDVRHSLYGDAARDLIRHAPGRGLAGGMGRWSHLRCDRLLRRCLEDWCTGRVCGRHRTDLRRRSRAPP